LAALNQFLYLLTLNWREIYIFIYLKYINYFYFIIH
jgi:hypothetical protein